MASSHTYDLKASFVTLRVILEWSSQAAQWEHKDKGRKTLKWIGNQRLKSDVRKLHIPPCDTQSPENKVPHWQLEEKRVLSFSLRGIKNCLSLFANSNNAIHTCWIRDNFAVGHLASIDVLRRLKSSNEITNEGFPGMDHPPPIEWNFSFRAIIDVDVAYPEGCSQGEVRGSCAQKFWVRHGVGRTPHPRPVAAEGTENVTGLVRNSQTAHH